MHEKIADLTGVHHVRKVKGSHFEHDPHRVADKMAGEVPRAGDEVRRLVR